MIWTTLRQPRDRSLTVKVSQNNTAESTLQTRFVSGGVPRDWKVFQADSHLAAALIHLEREACLSTI